MNQVSHKMMGGLALVALAGLTTSSAFAQTTVEPSGAPINTAPSATGAPKASPADRNVGPDSTVGGRSNDLGNADSGLPRVPGALSTSGDGSTGGH